MEEYIALNGGDWKWRNAHKPDTRDTRLVSGSVYHDLWANGEIPKPYFERNSLLEVWVARLVPF